MDNGPIILRPEGLQRFQALHAEAIGAVTERLYATHGSLYAQFGSRGRDACREDLSFHLEFLRPVLEFGVLQPMVDYLVWLGSVLAARAIPAEHLVLSLNWLGEFFVENMDPADGAVVSAALAAAATKFLSEEAPSRQEERGSEVQKFEAALLAGRRTEAMGIVTAAIDGGRGLVDVELNIIQPALYDIGEKWQSNRVTVAQEHLATAIAQSLMTVGLLRSPPSASTGKRVLLACVAGNRHAIGLQMVSDAFQLAGWDVNYLGADTPTSALVAHASAWKPNIIGLSVSFAAQLRAVKEAIAQLGQTLGAARPAVIVGGFAMNRFSQLASVVGADAHCVNSRAAVVYAARAGGTSDALVSA
jgi:MerR family transcriptional regulator, light-induced transcriptional regulator